MRWGRIQLAIDRIEHSDEILCHIIIPKADDAIAVGGEFRAALLVGCNLINVLATVQLDDESLFRTGKVRYAIGDRMLAAEFVVGQAVAKRAPQDAFGVG